MSDDPLVSLTQLPMGGMWQVIFTIMCLEWLTTYICKPPEDRPWDVLGWKGIIDEDYPSEIWNGWKRVQCQELNNSRLAMVAITGLVAQDVVTGDYVAGVGKLCGGAAVCNQPIDYSPWQNLGRQDSFRRWSSVLQALIPNDARAPGQRHGEGVLRCTGLVSEIIWL
eukprot:s505_g7.t1